MGPFRLSLQLYTIRSETALDFLGACRRVAEIGFEWVEPAGFGGISPERLQRELEGMGLGVSGSHVACEAVLEEAERTIEDHQALGCREVTVASLPRKFRRSKEAWLQIAGRLNETAERFAGAGIRLGYHNHDFEFERFAGRAGWDILFDSAPRLCAQVDTFWVVKAGRNPAECIRRLSGRVPSVHVKDMREDGEDVEFGLGVLDWEDIFAACDETRVETLVVEMDNPKLPPFESIEVCLRNLEERIVG